MVAPPLGPILDRRGARLMLCLAVLGTGLSCMALSLTPSLVVFYLLFCFARMIWAAPFELGLYGALNNWFVTRRRRATSIATLFQMSGLVAMPLIAQYAMRDGGWRAGWVAIGATVLVVGFLPTWALLVRQPEDLGLAPDGHGAGKAAATPEPTYSAPAGDAHARLLAALALHRAGLSGAGGRQPASGAAPDRARPLADRWRRP